MILNAAIHMTTDVAVICLRMSQMIIRLKLAVPERYAVVVRNVGTLPAAPAERNREHIDQQNQCKIAEIKQN